MRAFLLILSFLFAAPTFSQERLSRDDFNFLTPPKRETDLKRRAMIEGKHYIIFVNTPSVDVPNCLVGSAEDMDGDRTPRVVVYVPAKGEQWRLVIGNPPHSAQYILNAADSYQRQLNAGQWQMNALPANTATGLVQSAIQAVFCGTRG